MRNTVVRRLLAQVSLGGIAVCLAASGCGSGNGATTGGDGSVDGGAEAAPKGDTGTSKDSGKDAAKEGGTGTHDSGVKDSSSGDHAVADTGIDAAAECSDGVKDGMETDVDCGGAVCDALGHTCATGKACTANADCTSPDGGAAGCDATTHVCDPTQCSDGVKDGMETDVDCGGSVCDALGQTCAPGKACTVDADCKSADGGSAGCDSTMHVCDATQCSDGVKDGMETDVDCGGAVCDALGDTCAVGKACAANADCASGDGCDVTTMTCDANQCHDGVKDGMETDVDCGGSVCDGLGDTCAVGGACATNADCASGDGCDVTTMTCDANQCHDGVQDGMETAVDCGGATCDAVGDTCAAGLACGAGADCATGLCCSSLCSNTDCPAAFAAPAAQTTTINSIASGATGTAGTASLTLATPANFAAGQTVLVQQVQGANAGTWELAVISAVNGSTATLLSNLSNTYSNMAPATAQAVVVPQYTTVDVPATAVLTAPAWNGSTGGVLAFQATGAVTIEGSVVMDGDGFRGFSHQDNCPPKACAANPINGFAGESVAGPAIESTLDMNGDGLNNVNGGGGGTYGQDCGMGGGGAYGPGSVAGPAGSLGVCIASPSHGGGDPGTEYGQADLSTSLVFGGAGGEGGPDEDGAYPGAGGNGGGSIVILAPTSSVTVTGSISSGGTAGGNGVINDNFCSGGGCGMGGGGGGAGGSIRIVTAMASLGTNLVQATGGGGGSCTCGGYSAAGAGSVGRIQVTSGNISGTTNPPAAP